MKAVARQAAQRVAPGLLADRARRHSLRVRRDRGLLDIAQVYTDRCGLTVRSGAVRGLRYPRHMVDLLDAPVAMLLGSYEREIHDELEREIERGPTRFLDIGAGVGHYAVGLTRRMPSVETVAFELSRSARCSCRVLADLNGVDGRLQLLGRADAGSVARAVVDGALVLSDCEGAEADIFSDATVPHLRQATLVVEAHESVRPGVTDLLTERFGKTHDPLVIPQQPRDADDYPELGELPAADRDVAIDELRSRRDPWLVLRPSPGMDPSGPPR